MAGSGEIYRRTDNKWAFRVRASNGAIVAVDGSQGYVNKADARATLTALMAGSYNGPVTES
jgi:uncharacterized protein YegP (UPF0339 family)